MRGASVSHCVGRPLSSGLGGSAAVISSMEDESALVSSAGRGHCLPTAVEMISERMHIGGPRGEDALVLPAQEAIGTLRVVSQSVVPELEGQVGLP